MSTGRKCQKSILLLLSIITVNFNDKPGLQKTFDSVFNQTFRDFEYIVIDGGSNDGSKELIEEKSKHISFSVSEPDRGIYDAMNKGIGKARGEYLLFLNSGDYLCDGFVLEKVFSQELKHDIIYGDIIWDTDGVKTEYVFPDTISFEYFARHNYLPHQGTFIRRSLFTSIGPYEEDYKIIADWVFFLLAICKYNYSYKHIRQFISVCDRSGISCRPERWNDILEDRKKALHHYFPAFIKDYEMLQSLKSESRSSKMKWIDLWRNRLKKLLQK